MSIGSQSLGDNEIFSCGGEFKETLEGNESSRSSDDRKSSSRNRWLFFREGAEGLRNWFEDGAKKDMSFERSTGREYDRFCFLRSRKGIGVHGVFESWIGGIDTEYNKDKLKSRNDAHKTVYGEGKSIIPAPHPSDERRGTRRKVGGVDEAD
ncbi:hypothetical protein BDZ97DRAFT_1751663 [Flammula alnicola]|nr:hypothetical protein BDZ97DRAFT_1751663 [Flammula alnicola]